MRLYILHTAIALLGIAPLASAHVAVWPNRVEAGSFQTFNISVPAEENQPTVGIRIVLPEGLSYVVPTVKSGWKIELVQEEQKPRSPETIANDTLAEEKVLEITWSGGSIPGHQRDDFSFSAKVPNSEGTLPWKIYQIYKDGRVVSWDLDPSKEQPKKSDGMVDFSSVGPLMQTVVTKNLTVEPSFFDQPYVPIGVSVLAFLFSIIAILNTGKRKA